MGSILFVHGTGVRAASYAQTFRTIQMQVQKYLPAWQPLRCFWGELHGARLNFAGVSIPGYDTARAIDIVQSEDEEVVLWQMLYGDPLYELRWLVASPTETEELAPNEEPPWQLLKDQVEHFTLSTELAELLRQCRLDEIWDEACTVISATPEVIDAITTASGGAGEQRTAIARSFVAQAVAMALEQGIPAPDGQTRDALVRQIVADLGGEERGIGIWIGNQLKGLALRFVTRKLERQRGVLSDGTSPVAGDVLLYQVRGVDIRSFICQQVVSAPEPVVLLSHSLGGVACVDLLVQEKLPTVKALITVGSQAPLLYEIDALTSLRVRKMNPQTQQPVCETLPEHFPPWLNFYDPHDFLSFLGSAIFPGKVEDYEVQSRQPFPQSHSAYWSNQELWQKIAEFLT